MTAGTHGRESLGQVVPIERDKVTRLLAVDIDDGNILSGIRFEPPAEPSLDDQVGLL